MGGGGGGDFGLCKVGRYATGKLRSRQEFQVYRAFNEHTV